MSPMIAPSAGRAASRIAASAAPAALSIALATPALADHPMVNVRTEGMSPLALALLTGGLALAAVLLVVVIAMLLTRRPSAPDQAGE